MAKMFWGYFHSFMMLILLAIWVITEIEESGKEKIVIKGIDDKENKTENIVVKGDVGSKRRRRRGQTFNYDVDEEIHSIVTQMNEK